MLIALVYGIFTLCEQKTTVFVGQRTRWQLFWCGRFSLCQWTLTFVIVYFVYVWRMTMDWWYRCGCFCWCARNLLYCFRYCTLTATTWNSNIYFCSRSVLRLKFHPYVPSYISFKLSYSKSSGQKCREHIRVSWEYIFNLLLIFPTYWHFWPRNCTHFYHGWTGEKLRQLLYTSPSVFNYNFQLHTCMIVTFWLVIKYHVKGWWHRQPLVILFWGSVGNEMNIEGGHTSI